MRYFFLIMILCVGCKESHHKCAEFVFPRSRESHHCYEGQHIELHQDIIVCRCPSQLDTLLIDAGQ